LVPLSFVVEIRIALSTFRLPFIRWLWIDEDAASRLGSKVSFGRPVSILKHNGYSDIYNR
jgi:hypothetical protein